MLNYKCKICNKNLKKPDDKTEIFWDNVQTLFDFLWRKDYKYINNITDEKKIRTRINVFNMMCDYKCCSKDCAAVLRKRAGIYSN